MIHYSIWFRLRDSMEEAEGLAVVQTFLNELRAAGEIAGFEILRNRSGSKTMRLPFQALIEFQDNAQFAAAFSAQGTRGIHNGLHGRVIRGSRISRSRCLRRCFLPTAQPS
jgi:hypothetical protein